MPSPAATKPRLLKFTCHSCGARLAVPPEMAGLSDSCPKCGEIVTAPSATTSTTAKATTPVSSASVMEPAAKAAVPPASAPATEIPAPAKQAASADMATASSSVAAPVTATSPKTTVPEDWSTESLTDALKPGRPSLPPPAPDQAPAPKQEAPAKREEPAKAEAPPPAETPAKQKAPASDESPVPAQAKGDGLTKLKSLSTLNSPPEQAPSAQVESPAKPEPAAKVETPAAADPAPEPKQEATAKKDEPQNQEAEIQEAAPTKQLAPKPSTTTVSYEVQPNLMDTVAGEAEAPRKPAHEVLDSILRRKEPLRKPASTAAEPPASESLTAEKSDDALPSGAPQTALVPRQLTDAHEVAKAAMPGMGEVLASAPSRLTPMSSSEARPLLQVPFLPVRPTAWQARRARMTHLWNMGIICFLLVDVLLVVLAILYKDRIASWWRRGSQETTSKATVAAHAPAQTPTPSAPAAASDQVVATTTPAPAVSAPEAAAPPAVASASSPASEPVNSAPPAASRGPVPMAIPLPTLSAENTPAPAPPADPAPASATPAPESTPTPAAAASSASSGPSAPALPPLPDPPGTPAIATAPIPAAPLPEPPSSTTPPSPSAPAPESTAGPKEASSATPTAPAGLPPTPPATSLPGAEATLAAPTALTAPMAGVTAASTVDAPPAPPPSDTVFPPPPAALPIDAEFVPPAATAAATTGATMPLAPVPGPIEPVPVEAAPAASGTATPRKIGKVPAEATSALTALEKFLDAPNWRERAAHVQKPDTVRGAMEKHASTFGDGPVKATRIEFVQRYPSKAGVPPYCMFEVSGGALDHAVLVLVEQSTKNGVRVDWEAFVEFKDNLLLRFLEKKSSPPQKFRGLLRRKHYFDKDVPDITSKDSFELAQPNAHFEGHVFVPRNSPLGKQLANQLPWNQDMPVIAELVWKSDGKTSWVQIESIASYGWRG